MARALTDEEWEQVDETYDAVGAAIRDVVNEHLKNAEPFLDTEVRGRLSEQFRFWN